MTPGAAQDDPRDLWSFEGHWSLSREIDDRRAGHVARAEGEAEMRRDAAGLVYAEEVRLVLPGQRPALSLSAGSAWRGGVFRGWPSVPRLRSWHRARRKRPLV